MLHLHRAERADGLLLALAAVLADPPDDPFAADLVAVPSRGVERWLAQRLSHLLGAIDAAGVTANVDFPSPHRLVEEALACGSGISPDDDPWPAERSVWPLLGLVDEHLDAPWAAALRTHIARAERRFVAVAHVAGLFDRYAALRPDLLRAWAAGDDEGVPPDARWQPTLWRLLREHLQVPGPAERLTTATQALAADPTLVDLPQRLSVFGLTRLPAARLEVLTALAQHRDVHLFLLHPSPALWQRLTAKQPPASARRANDPTATEPRNRLLASWGRDARELQLVLQRAAPTLQDDHHAPQERREPDTLLRRIQHAVHTDAPDPPPDDRPPLDPHDRSLVLHSCHGRARQVEVLRDALLHLFVEDPTLEPRDVIVMCPDIETFAPLLHAAFGTAQALAEEQDDQPDTDEPALQDPRPRLHVRLADRSLRQTNPVLGVVARLLELGDARLTASEVLDLADREPVRRRFGLDDDALARLEDWAAASGVRWGLDAPHREPYKLQALEQGSWKAGLDRVLAGVAMTEDERLLGGTLPLDDVGSSDIDLAGRLAELTDRLHAFVDRAAAPQPIDAWAAAIAEAADALTATTERDAWQRLGLDRLLEDVITAANGSRAELTLGDVRALLADRLKGRPTRANFRTGHLTVCTLVPMRTVPHRVVCLLGLDDEVFPRGAHRDGDDLVLADPHLGDRDPRLEDRQLLLDALLSATDKVLITFTGRDERTNERRPPAVPIGELLDVVDRTVATPDGTPARERVLVEHPLQPFDPDNFHAGALTPGRPWGFDPTMLDGAVALQTPRTTDPRFLAAPLPPLDERVLDLDDLVRFVGHPVGAFLRQRLGRAVRRFDDEPSDALDLELDELGRWGLGERLLQALLAGATPDEAATAERARGLLPPGLLGQQEIERVWRAVHALTTCAAEVAPTDTTAASVDVRVTLPDGRALGGTVPGLRGTTLRTVTYSRLGPKARLTAWVRHLALSAARPDGGWEAVTIGRAGAGSGDHDTVSIARLPVLDGAAALDHLQALVDLRDRGLRRPLPLVCKTSSAYAEAAFRGADGTTAARRRWETAKFPGEDQDPEHELAFGGRLGFERLVQLPGIDEATERAWAPKEPTAFGRYARRLHDGLLALEQVSHR